MKFSSYMISESVILTGVGLYPAKKKKPHSTHLPTIKVKDCKADGCDVWPHAKTSFKFTICLYKLVHLKLKTHPLIFSVYFF